MLSFALKAAQFTSFRSISLDVPAAKLVMSSPLVGREERPLDAELDEEVLANVFLDGQARDHPVAVCVVLEALRVR